MSRNKICGCGKIIDYAAVCECKKEKLRQRSMDKKVQNPEATAFYTSAKWRKFRIMILKRDGAHCQRCIIKYHFIVSTNLEIHHIKPRSKYPELAYDEDNCITLCKSCNTQLGVKEELDFIKRETKREYFL